MNSSQSNHLSLFERIMVRYLGRLRGGRLRLELPGERVEYLGDGEGPEVIMKILDAGMPRRLVLGGSMALGEGYVDGAWTTPDLSATLTLLARNQKKVGRIGKGLSVVGHWLNRLYHVRRSNTLEQSKSNIEAHYDLSNDFYALFLDPTMTYSSALFESRKEDSLEAGQEKRSRRCCSGRLVRRAGICWRLGRVGAPWHCGRRAPGAR